ncbi:MAG: multicopper oxidase domain-containing protein [Chloroflexi bacterium]|nr:multicopper oxidase domain-containing protein [Chloroflexota bacterium]
MEINRRQFLKVGGAGLTAVALGSTALYRWSLSPQATGKVELDLEMMAVDHEMVDGHLIYRWAFAINGQPSMPGPVIFAAQGDSITLNITNNLDQPHSFAIKGNESMPFVVSSPPIPPGATAPVTFTAPAPGTYIYQDLVEEPVGRLLGLHGVLVAMPAKPFEPHDTPYGRLASDNPVQMLFDDLGRAEWFPGDVWRPERQIFWIFSELDPAFCQKAERGEHIDPADILKNYLPSYFFINGRSGFFSSFDHVHEYAETGARPKPIPPPDGFIPAQELDTAVMGYQGEPVLIRMAHVGLDTHSPHTHANHHYIIAHNGRLLDDRSRGAIVAPDTSTLFTEDRKDMLFPMTKPPDIPDETWAKLIAGTSQEGLGPDDGQSHWNVAHPGPGFPMTYPMHSHQELSQTAAGGNYPQGLITHIEFLGAYSQRRPL